VADSAIIQLSAREVRELRISPLMLAAGRGHEMEFQLLMAERCQVNKRDKLGR
jgi:hypothetical protein